MKNRAANSAAAVLAVAAMSTTLPAGAYEVTTHQLLSGLAVEKSQPYVTANVFARLGFPARDVAAYRFSGKPLDPPRTFVEIVQDGAGWEDDQYDLVVCNHFFDPQANNGQGIGLADPLYLTPLLCRGVGIESPLWSLEDSSTPGDIMAPTGYHEFSMRRAYAALRQALAAPLPADRSAAMSRTLQSLGHMIHHLQDMGQPQHTRNEGHPHNLSFYAGEAVGGYEIYTDTPASRQRIPVIVRANPYPPIPPTALPSARHLWHTPGAPAPAYYGMAEFTSHNFPSYRRSFVLTGGQVLLGGQIVAPPTGVGPDPQHPLPNGTNVDTTPKRLVPQFDTDTLKNGTVVSGNRYYVYGKVYDGLRGASSGEMRLGVVGLEGSVTEDPIVFDNRHNVLLPRAVAFSTALIDYFFRGQISLEPTAVGNEWTIRNAGQLLLDGRVQLYTENAAGERYSPPTGSGFYVTLTPGATRAVTFTLPDDAKKVIAVFEGQIGTEGDKTIDPLAVTPLFNHVTGAIIEAPGAPDIVVSPSTVPLTAAGTAVPVTVKLSGPPRRNETVSVTRQNGSTSINASPAQLIFTPSNYQTAQVVNVTGAANPASAQAAVFGVSNDHLAPVTLNVSQPAGLPSIPCNSPLAANGHSGVTPYRMDLGTATGRVQVQFEAYSIPDGLVVKRGQQVKATTNGQVSGLSTFEFQQNTGDERYLDITVSGNSDAGTVWELSISCPGAAAALPNPPVDVVFDVKLGTTTCSGHNTYVIDGRTTVEAYWPGSLPPPIKLSPGPHVFQFTKQVVSAPWCASESGHIRYRDGSGIWKDLWIGANASGILWVCRSATNCTTSGPTY